MRGGKAGNAMLSFILGSTVIMGPSRSYGHSWGLRSRPCPEALHMRHGHLSATGGIMLPPVWRSLLRGGTDDDCSSEDDDDGSPGVSSRAELDPKADADQIWSEVIRHIDVIEKQKACEKEAKAANRSLFEPSADELVIENVTILNTRLWEACVEQNDDNAFKFVGKLAAMGAQPNAQDETRWSNTALHFAAENGMPCTVSMLLDYGGIPDQRNSREQTALHLAAGHGHWGTALELLDGGADINARDFTGQDAYHLADAGEHHLTARMLLELMSVHPGSVSAYPWVNLTAEIDKRYGTQYIIRYDAHTGRLEPRVPVGRAEEQEEQEEEPMPLDFEKYLLDSSSALRETRQAEAAGNHGSERAEAGDLASAVSSVFMGERDFEWLAQGGGMEDKGQGDWRMNEDSGGSEWSVEKSTSSTMSLGGVFGKGGGKGGASNVDTEERADMKEDEDSSCTRAIKGKTGKGAKQEEFSDEITKPLGREGAVKGREEQHRQRIARAWVDFLKKRRSCGKEGYSVRAKLEGDTDGEDGPLSSSSREGGFHRDTPTVGHAKRKRPQDFL